MGGRVVDVKDARAEAVSLSGKNGLRRELGGPSGSGVRSGSCGHQVVRGNGKVVYVSVPVSVSWLRRYAPVWLSQVGSKTAF